MCGLVAIIEQSHRTTTEALRDQAQRMTNALSHRGPDRQSIWIDAGAGVALGHTRLAVIDLSTAGNQPMVSADGTMAIAYNGELYNAPQIRDELSALGRTFRGHSDTEVLLEGCSAWGVRECLSRADGMFAFALWDSQQRTMTLARDRLGEKPLYWGQLEGQWLIASELKALRAHPAWRGQLDPAALADYLRCRCIPAPLTIYRGFQKLPPAHLLEVRLNAKPRMSRYWEAATVAARGPIAIDDETAIDELERLLGDAVARRMVSDVPLGSFLSGGIDSSLVTTMMQMRAAAPVRTFSIGFRADAFNEAPFARAIATHLGTDHTELYVDPADAMELIPRLAEIYDEPFADASQIPTCLLAALTRQHVTVALSGDGGDELFGGYRRYQETDRAWARLNRMPKLGRRLAGFGLQAVGKALRDTPIGRSAAGSAWLPSTDRLEYWSSIATVADADAFYAYRGTQWRNANDVLRHTPESNGHESTATTLIGDFITRMQLADLTSYLPDDILTKVDRATMAVALEARVPLLDRRVVEFALGLPTRLKVRNTVGKWLLRQVLARHLPKNLFERPKAGFSVPLGSWLRGPLRPWAESLLDRRRLEVEGLLEPAIIVERWQQHLAGRRDWSAHLWTVLMLQAWLDRTHAARGSVLDRNNCVASYAAVHSISH